MVLASHIRIASRFSCCCFILWLWWWWLLLCSGCFECPSGAIYLVLSINQSQKLICWWKAFLMNDCFQAHTQPQPLSFSTAPSAPLQRIKLRNVPCFGVWINNTLLLSSFLASFFSKLLIASLDVCNLTFSSGCCLPVPEDSLTIPFLKRKPSVRQENRIAEKLQGDGAQNVGV